MPLAPWTQDQGAKGLRTLGFLTFFFLFNKEMSRVSAESIEDPKLSTISNHFPCLQTRGQTIKKKSPIA